MKKIFCSQIIILLALCCCNQPADNNTQTVSSNNDSPQVKVVPKKDSVIKKDSAITNKQTLFPGADTLVAAMHIDGVKDRKILPVQIASGQHLYAKLIPSNAQANLRINQVQMPDSSLDGPFGRELNYEIKTPGTYKLIIGESLMAEGNWKGDFLIKIWVK